MKRCVPMAIGLLGWVLLTSCRTAAFDDVVEQDPLDRGQIAMDRGDLAAALCAFDEVAATDPRYATARLNAAAVEQQLVRQQELVLLGLRLRSEWRDDEAVAVFTEALSTWPADTRTEALLRGTIERRRLLADARSLEPSTADQDSSEPLGPANESLALPAPMGESAPLTDGTSQTPAETRIGPDDVVAAKLVRLEDRLQRGELDSVLAEFAAMQDKWPGDPRVCGRLSRLLLQRGLLHYGRGQIDAAIADWRRAQRLDPQLPSLSLLIELATRELSQPPR
ncbi:MAG: hypothetical protein ABL997_03305 [Planctomycetota bacterium]